MTRVALTRKLHTPSILLMVSLLVLFPPAYADFWSELATGDLKALKRGNYDVNARHPQNGSTPLITATVLQNHDVVRWLIKEGADVNMRGADGGTALHAAAFIGADKIAIDLLKSGANLDARNASGVAAMQLTYLDWTTTKNFLDMLNLPLTEAHVMAGRKNIQDYVQELFVAQAKTNMWAAAALGDIKSVRKLLRKGYDVNAVNKDTGTTPLQTASLFGHAALVQLLIDEGANVDQANPNNGSTALHAAALFGRADVTRVLLKNGADPTVFDDNGGLPIDAADLDWETTNGVASMLQLRLDRKTTMAGKSEVARLLTR